MPVVSYLEEVYSNGSSQILVHSGFNYVDICAVGGGGAGRRGGGGAGGVATKTYRVLESEWGTFLTCSVGAAVVSANGLPTTVTGTLNGGAITELKGFGGDRGANVIGGVGGSFSGGDAVEWPTMNLAGADGTEYVDSANPGVGGFVGDILLYQAGSHTIGAGGVGDVSNGQNGFAGNVYLRWKV
jgi:hypothetical protein